MISVPAEGREGGLDAIIFHSQDLFLERPLEMPQRILLPKATSEPFVQERGCYPEINVLDEEGLLKRHRERLREPLQQQLGSSDLEKRKWLAVPIE